MDASPEERSCSVRTVLADGEPTVRRALRTLVTQGLDMQVVGEADTAPDLQSQVRLHEPDLVIVAWNLLVTQAESVLQALRSSSRGLRIVVLGLRPETRQTALTAGADGFISMVDAPEVVIRALQSAAATEMDEPGGVS